MGLGVRWTMEWRLKEGVTRIRGMWKTFAERLGIVRSLVQLKREENVPIAYHAYVVLFLCHCEVLEYRYSKWYYGSRIE